MAVIGLREQTIKDAKNVADARARHRWQIPADYNVALDCIDRHTDLRDKPAPEVRRVVPYPKPSEPTRSAARSKRPLPG